MCVHVCACVHVCVRAPLPFSNVDFKAIQPINKFNVYSLSCRFGPYFTEPIVAGLQPKTFEPYIASCDLIGCATRPEDFVVCGTCDSQLYGWFTSLYSAHNYSVFFYNYIH